MPMGRELPCHLHHLGLPQLHVQHQECISLVQVTAMLVQVLLSSLQETGRPAAKSISFARPPASSPLPPPAGTLYLSDIFRGSESLPSQTTMPHSPTYSTADHMVTNVTPQQVSGNNTAALFKGRPRACTSPLLPSLFGGDHQSWFNDPQFDGSFLSQVLPFLYLGNLFVSFFVLVVGEFSPL